MTVHKQQRAHIMTIFNIESLSAVITVLGTAAFALSAVLAANGKEVDLFTIIILAIITAVGGGTIRDVLLDEPIFWAQDTSFIWISMLSSLLGFMFFGLLKKRRINALYLYIDALAVAMFAIQATSKAWHLGFGLPISPVFMGLITAIGGGMIRDTLLQRPTLLFSKDLYAIPVTFGCLLHACVLAYAPEFTFSSAIVSILLILVMRSMSIFFNIGVPQWALLGHRFTFIKN